jgi:hypothetical protein
MPGSIHSSFRPCLSDVLFGSLLLRVARAH